MEIVLLSHTENPEKIIEIAARTCYSSKTPIELYQELIYRNTNSNSGEFLDKLKKMGHLTPFEHANFTFAITGISRACLAQLTRHRLCSFNVQSQRYVALETSNEALNDQFYYSEELQKAINTHSLSQYLLDLYQFVVNDLQEKGYTKTEAIENARYLLPLATTTNLVMTMNARELMHFFEVRCCNRAQKEIRDLAWMILQLLQQRFYSIFKDCGPKCLTGKCPEGPMSCGKPFQKASLE